MHLFQKFQRRGARRRKGAVEGRRSHWLHAAASGAADTSGHSIIDGPVMNICSPSHAGRSRREAVFCMTCFKWWSGGAGGRGRRPDLSEVHANIALLWLASLIPRSFSSLSSSLPSAPLGWSQETNHSVPQPVNQWSRATPPPPL